MHIVETPFCICRLCYIYIIIIIKNCQRSVNRLCFTNLYRRCVSKIHMLQHLSTFCIFRHFKDIEGVFLTISTPVILWRLDRCIHLIDPCSCQCRVSAACSQNTSSSVKSTGLTVILSCDIYKSVRSCKCREHHIIFIVVDVCNIPGKAQAISVVLAFCNIGRPFLGKCLRIYKVLFHQLVQPLNSFFIAFLHGCINNRSIILYSKMITGISISFAESINENCRILVSIVDNE